MKLELDATELVKRMRKVINKTPIELSAELNRGGNIVVSDIKDKASKSIRIDGKGNYEPLQDKTIERKREAGMPFPEYPLIGTGQMTGALLTGGDGPYIKKRATPKDLEVEITAPNVKAPYGQYHQVGHSRGYFPARPWFGVSKEANKGIYKSLGMAIGRMTRAK